MESVIALLSNPSLKRAVVAVATTALIALNKKLGLGLELGDIASITALAIAFLGQSAMKEVRLAGVNAAAKVGTVSDAVAVLNSSVPK